MSAALLQSTSFAPGPYNWLAQGMTAEVRAYTREGASMNHKIVVVTSIPIQISTTAAVPLQVSGETPV